MHEPTRQHKRNIRELGLWLRKARKDRGHRQQDVADAIGRKVQYVSDVEHGRRGHKMDPIVAMMWCEYLVLDPVEAFAYLGLGDTQISRLRVQHYLETGAWARRLIEAKRHLERALPAAEEIARELKARDRLKSQSFQVRDAVRGAIEALRIPRNDKEENSEIY